MMDSSGATPPADFAAALTLTAGDIRNVVAEAARNRPRYGSVTQSSNGDGVTTTDRVRIAADLGDDGVVTYTLDASLGGESFDLVARGRGQAGSSEYQDELSSTRVIGGTSGTLYVRTLTNFEDPADSVEDTDYLSVGYWAFLPGNETNTANLSFGAFADGTDPFVQDNMAGLTDTAEYVGGAGGVFVVGAGEETSISPFEATARLTADFDNGGPLGSISGSIDEVAGRDGTPLNPSPEVTLGRAAIGGSNSGFFTGATAMRYGDDRATYTGSWGGYFLGNGAAATDHPLGVVGTFGASTVEGETPTRSLVGAFLARRNEASP